MTPQTRSLLNIIVTLPFGQKRIFINIRDVLHLCWPKSINSSFKLLNTYKGPCRGKPFLGDLRELARFISRLMATRGKLVKPVDVPMTWPRCISFEQFGSRGGSGLSTCLLGGGRHCVGGPLGGRWGMREAVEVQHVDQGVVLGLNRYSLLLIRFWAYPTHLTGDWGLLAPPVTMVPVNWSSQRWACCSHYPSLT